MTTTKPSQKTIEELRKLATRLQNGYIDDRGEQVTYDIVQQVAILRKAAREIEAK